MKKIEVEALTFHPYGIGFRHPGERYEIDAEDAELMVDTLKRVKRVRAEKSSDADAPTKPADKRGKK